MFNDHHTKSYYNLHATLHNLLVNRMADEIKGCATCGRFIAIPIKNPHCYSIWTNEQRSNWN